MPFVKGYYRKLNSPDVLGCRSFFPLTDIKGNAVTFRKRFESRTANFRMMDKYVLPILLFNKPISLGIMGPRISRQQAEERKEKYATRAVEAVISQLEQDKQIV